MINKKQLEYNFHQASSTYDDVAKVQYQSAKVLTNKLIDAFPHFTPQSILDLGTGTGYIPSLLLQIFPLSHYSLNDIAQGMLQRAKERFSFNNKFSYILGDIESLNFAPHDLIISNFALQWMDDLSTTISKLYSKAKILAFSCLLDGTFKEWGELFETNFLPIPTYKYPSQKNIEEIFVSLKPEKHSFHTIDYATTFVNPPAFMRHLKLLGASMPNNNISLCDLRNLILTNNHEIIVTYKVFFGIIKRV